MQSNSELNFLSQVQKTLNQNPDARQREFAMSANLSLGMTNALLRRFTDKGWLYMKKISTRNIQYILTTNGINELAYRSTQYFKRTARLMKNYKECITTVIDNAMHTGCKTLLLVGETDLEFLFTFACVNAHIDFLKILEIPLSVTSTTLIVFVDKEQYDNACLLYTGNFIYISKILHLYEVENQEILCQSI